MKGSRRVAVAAVMAAAVSVAPAIGAGKIGAGKDASGPLAWSQGGARMTSYSFATVAFGSRGSRNFRLKNWDVHVSGKFAIRLTGSSAFSISSNRCAGKNLGTKKWCRVTVAYAPSQAGARDHAVLTATRKHRTAARLNLSGCSADGSGHIYWTGDGTVNQGLFAAGCPTRVTILASRQDLPTSTIYPSAALAVDGTHVYWANLDGTVNKVPIGGGTVTTLATSKGIPSSLTVDGTHVYWVNYYEGTVNEVPIGGGTVTTLASGQAYPGSVATDGTNVYWANSGTVNEVPVGGGTVTTIASGQDPVSVAVDGTHVYWADTGSNAVNEVPVGGGTVTTLASGQDRPDSVAVHGTHIYWATEGGAVNEVPLSGGTVSTLATGQPDYPLSLAVSGTHVYWSNANAMVKEVSVDGGTVHMVSRGQWYAAAVSVGP